ncbi:MAG TPA: hypothetical protein VJZ00_18235 [Thermoanaerobaculia bacterium]|nr:hypothetical protein [Thermoanaerobaculia bacterium]
MNVAEPMTLATDYLICVIAIVFGVRLWRVFRPWSLAFFFTAAGSLFGGTFHGFGGFAMWKATIFSIALASFFLLSGCGRVLTSIGIVKLVATMSWMIAHDDFQWVILDYGISLLLVGIWIRVRPRSAPWVWGSIAVSVLAALVQHLGFSPHPHFNHNDLYHVIQIVALWLLYRGGLLMTSSTDRPTIPPT